jgi:hypothetical protein
VLDALMDGRAARGLAGAAGVAPQTASGPRSCRGSDGHLFFRSCLDWTARRPFLRGTLGVALICGYFEPGWTERIKGSRAVAITEKRRHELHQAFGFRLEQQ